jgi:hypothetical protein
MRSLLPLRILGKVFSFTGKVASYMGPKGEVAGAALGTASTAIGFLNPTPGPLCESYLSPATYLAMDNGLNKLDIQKAA